LAKVIVKNKMSRFLWFTVYIAGLDRGTCPDTFERVYNHVLTS